MREYTIQRLSEETGLTPRTLRYYDEIGLFCPARVGENGYRYYERAQLDELNDILFYRALGVRLEEIRPLMAMDDEPRAQALTRQLAALKEERAALDGRIADVQNTIRHLRGEKAMPDTEKFARIKQQAIRENEENYGRELRQKYGEATVEAANARTRELSEAEWNDRAALEARILEELRELTPANDPACPRAQALAQMHARWLTLYWQKGTLTPEKHCGLAQMYTQDERFRAYYEAAAPGAADYLKRAIENLYTK